MIPNAFEYFAPGSVAEAIGLLTTHGEDARVLAGGHSLIPAMRLRLAQPRVVVDIGRIPGLSYIRQEQGVLAIGAMTSHYEIETSNLVREQARALQDAAAGIGDVQVRNRGTIGGSAAHADPAADYPAVLVALGAEMVATGPAGTRRIAAADFFQGPLTTALQKNEILTEIRIPAAPPRSGSAYAKFSHRHSDFALVGCAAQVTLDAAGRCQAARVALTGVGPHAFRALAVEQRLIGLDPQDTAAVARACAHVVEGVEVNADPVTSAEFRSHIAQVYARRMIQAAAAHCQ